MHAESTASQTIHLQEITSTTPATTVAQARALLREYGRFVLQDTNTALFCFGSLEKEIEDLPLSYMEKGGGACIALVEDKPAGFIAWRAVAASEHSLPDASEMKRLWVEPAARGLGLGRVLTEAVLACAASAGRKAVYLETQPTAMPAAHRMYRALGFEPCAAYNGSPVEGLAYLVKLL